jgi:hypothetical protein
MTEGSGYVRLKDADAAPDPECPKNYPPEHCQGFDRYVWSEAILCTLSTYRVPEAVKHKTAQSVLRIRDVSDFFHPRSRIRIFPSRIRITEFKYFSPKNGF